MPNRVLGAQKPCRRQEFQTESGFRNPIPTECPRVTHFTSASGHSRFSRLPPGIKKPPKKGTTHCTEEPRHQGRLHGDGR